MKWQRLNKIFETRPLDKETKLAILQLLAATDDPKKEDELLRFIFSWENTEAHTKKTLLEGLQRINERTLAKEEQVARRTEKETRTATDELHRQEQIKAIKKRIKNL